MINMAATTSSSSRRAVKQAEAEWVVQKLADMVADMEPGDRLPKRAELMDRFQASERQVLHALHVLYDRGKIVRGIGRGNFVAESNQHGSLSHPGPSLIAADSRTIIAVANPDHSFFDQCMRTLFRHVETESMQLACRFVDPKTARDFASRYTLPRPLGFVVFSQNLAQLAARLQADGNRVVILGAPSEGSPKDVPSVFSDHETGGELAANYLIKLGHRRLAYCGDWNEQRSRTRGYELAIAKARRDGLDITSTIIDAAMRAEWEQSPTRAANFLRRPGAPTGIMAWNDREASDLLTILTQAGVRVPEDVSVIGYDNIEDSNWTLPPLTTMDAGIPRMIRAAVEVLTGAIPTQKSLSVMILPTLVIRNSTAPPPG